jgi:molecular chaperone IbpA
MWTTTFKTYVPYALGLDETFDRLESLAGGASSYPPHNIIVEGNGKTILEIAVAGFSKNDISVFTERNCLTVRAREKDKTERKYQHKGISNRSFEKSWQLSQDVEIKDVIYENGLLVIELQKELPDKQKRKVWM